MVGIGSYCNADQGAGAGLYPVLFSSATVLCSPYVLDHSFRQFGPFSASAALNENELLEAFFKSAVAVRFAKCFIQSYGIVNGSP